MEQILLIGSDKYGRNVLIERVKNKVGIYKSQVWYSEEHIKEHLKEAFKEVKERYILENRACLNGNHCTIIIDNIANLNAHYREYLLTTPLTLTSDRHSLVIMKYLLLGSLLFSPSSNEQSYQSTFEMYALPMATSYDSSYENNSSGIQRMELENLSVFSPKYTISSRMDEKRFQTLLQTEAGFYFQKYGVQYLNDASIPIAIAMQESGFDHEGSLMTQEGSLGIGQLGDYSEEDWEKVDIVYTAYNFETKTLDREVLTLDHVKDLETHIKLMTMRLQNLLEEFNYNVYATIQAYNYGPALMHKIIADYAEKTNQTEEEILLNQSDFGWIEVVKMQYANPKMFVPNWPFKTYGDGNYIEHVLSYLPNSEVTLSRLSKDVLVENVEIKPIETPTLELLRK